MKKLSLTFFLLAALWTYAQEKTQQSYSFSLEQAVSHALANNYSAINAGRDILIAKQKKQETTAMGLPQVNAGVDYTNNFEIPLSVIPAQFFDPNAPAGTFTAVAFSPKQSATVRATLSQLIFDGSYIVALQASKTYLKYYENAKLKNDVDIRALVTENYANVLLAEESIAILERNKTILDKTVGDTRETYKNGLTEQENVEQLEITLGSLNNNLNNARRMATIAYKMLKISLGIDVDAPLTLTDKLEDLTSKNLDLAFASGFDVNNNMDYQQALNFTQQRTLELKLQKSKALPSLSANWNFGYNTFDQNFVFFNTSQKWYNFSALNVSLSIPIFSSFARSARTQQAKIALDQSKTLLTETEQQLKLAYESAKSDYEFGIESYQTAKSNLALAERIERKQQVKFTEGLSSSFDFSEAQRQLYAAQSDYLQSMLNIINRRAALQKIINNK